MTEETVISPETITESMVDEFFNNEGSFKEIKNEEINKEEVKEIAKESEVVEEKVVEEKPKEEKKVNLGALHEERAKRKAEAEKARKAEERAAELERQLQQYLQKQEPTYEEDPLEVLRREHEQVKQVLIAEAKQKLAYNEEQQYWEKVRIDEEQFKADKPDFDEAISYLANSRIEELKDLGWDEQSAQKILKDEIKWITDKAYEDDVNPAERFYNLSKRRGFKAAETSKVNENSDEKFKILKKGVETNKPLPPASKSANHDLTAESLADMKVDALSSLKGQTEFDKAWAKLFG